MSYIVLEESLINEFFKFYYKDEYDEKIILNLFNHFKPFLITNKQIEKIFPNDEILQKILSTQIPYCEYIDTDNEPYSDEFYKEMLEKSKYKILLKKHHSSFSSLNYHTICIEDNPTHIYAKKFESSEKRDNAKKHIISLIKNADEITIIDKYLYNDTVIDNLLSWFISNDLKKDITINLQNGEQELQQTHIKQKFKKQGYDDITCKTIDKNTHDRYIIIDKKISINLTSGVAYLFNNKKDFTYIISEK